ncbi:MAG: metallophosphoesterase [Betaproteobacteria bacterium]|nr:metallophosphoesterase [Betaproteobacteria bacterium]
MFLAEHGRSSFCAVFRLDRRNRQLAHHGHAETWRFALIGDTPYSDYERAELPKMLDAIADRHVDLIAHIGDFKHGGDRCDDAMFEDRLRLFENSRAPFSFVPGDNEWTDCRRPSNGAYDPLERLDKLRRLFWQDGLSLGQKNGAGKTARRIPRALPLSGSARFSSSR